MFQDAIDSVTDSDDATRTLLLGGLLSLFGFLVLPLVPVAGYLLGVLDRTSEGETVPAFEDWGELSVDGLKAIAVTVVYGLVPAVLAVLLFLGGAAALASGRNVTGGLTLFVGVVVAVVTSLAVWYVLPAALVRLATEKRVGAAFEFGELSPVLRSGKYATGWLVALVVSLVGGAIVGGLAAVPVLGWLAAPFVAFPVNVIAAAIYGRAYGEALDIEGRDPGVEATRPAI